MNPGLDFQIGRLLRSLAYGWPQQANVTDQFIGTATLFGCSDLLLKLTNSSRTMFIVLGASMPMRTELGPIRTIVIAMSSPIRILSLVFLDSTNMILSLRFFLGLP